MMLDTIAETILVILAVIGASALLSLVWCLYETWANERAAHKYLKKLFGED